MILPLPPGGRPPQRRLGEPAMTSSAQNERSYRFQAMIQTCSLPPVPSWASADTVHESGLR